MIPALCGGGNTKKNWDFGVGKTEYLPMQQMVIYCEFIIPPFLLFVKVRLLLIESFRSP